MNWQIKAVAGTVAVLAAVATAACWPTRRATPTQVADPYAFTAAAWSTYLGGDQGLTQADYDALGKASPGLSAADGTAVRALASHVATADLTAGSQDAATYAAYRSYWPPAATTGVAAGPQCRNVAVLAASPAALPTTKAVTTSAGTRYAKTLVAYTGTCGTAVYTPAGPGVVYIYTQLTGSRWAPIRPAAIPQAPARSSSDTPPASAMADFGACGTTSGRHYQDLANVVAAFDDMCAAAKAAGVDLTITAGYRTRAQQTALFKSAVKYYGSSATARKWVAYADGVSCTSKHCSGLAVDVEPTKAATSWLAATVGCLNAGKFTAAAHCNQSSTPVERGQTYGFAATVGALPGYLEFALPTTAAPDCDPASLPVPNMVAAIFRCRLGQAGINGRQADQVVEQALVVSKCASGWNAVAAAYAGKYAQAPNPADGRLYTESGVFLISAKVADAGWVPGGSSALTDPVANINGAASLWLATRGWEQFACATGTDKGLGGGPVLAAFGGPALPGWAAQY